MEDRRRVVEDQLRIQDVLPRAAGGRPGPHPLPRHDERQMVQTALLASVCEHTPPRTGVQSRQVGTPACGCPAAFSSGGIPSNVGAGRALLGCPQALLSQEVGWCKRSPCLTRAYPQHQGCRGRSPRRGLGCPQNSFSLFFTRGGATARQRPMTKMKGWQDEAIQDNR